MSLIRLIGLMLLERFEKIGKGGVLIKGFKDGMDDGMLTSGLDCKYREIVEEGLGE
ncbi:hypothetical protein [Staphylococcus capitis]|uniref:hypothetical protein n=1 Tax=Staphylococcus capitis TaxID=29388 RepID=UPI0016434CA2|nr:hypothetical protein [Staphylococcus capitis]